jgi:formylglycine-generating enzyme required for sulfatase activity
VPGGTYYRTYTNGFSGPMGEMDQATVADFSLDKYLVTVGRFRQFVGAWNNGNGWTPPAGSGKHAYLPGGGLNAGAETGWVSSDDSNISPTSGNLACDSYATWTQSSGGGNENLPINCVTWWEAYAFCIWDGGFLPSEAEWEYAAAGGGGVTGQREYPWGSTANGNGCPGASCYAIFGCVYRNGGGACSIAPVGTAVAGAGLYGQLDLAGEVWEWNLDWYASPYVNPCTNCANLTPASYRVLRGGFFSAGYEGYLQSPNRGGYAPSYRSGGAGFRCARTP